MSHGPHSQHSLPDRRRREPGERRPACDLDDLLELTATSIEAPGTPDELEAVITAIAAAGHGAVAGHRGAITLARRAAAVWRTASPTQQLLARLVIVWVTPDDTATEPHRRSGTHALEDLLCDRIEEATERVRRGESFVPVAAPTHRNGVIDPAVLAERLRAAGDAADPAELTAALLRLRPDRDRLREARRMLPADDAVAQWFEQWAELCERDATRASSWSCATRTTTRGYTFRELRVEGMGTITPPSWPSPVTLGSARWRRFASDPAGVAWMGSLIPGLPASWARLGASTIGPTNEFRDVAHGDPAFLERLLDREVLLGDDANLLLALALNDQRAAVRTVAVDVTIAAIEDGRLDPRGLGVQVGRLASSGLVTPSRWVRSLADVAGAACDHRAAVEQVLEQAFTITDPPKPQDLLGLLELFETLALDSGAALTDDAARASLSRIGGHEQDREGRGTRPRVGGRMTTTTDELVYRYVGRERTPRRRGRLDLDLATSGGCGPNPMARRRLPPRAADRGTRVASRRQRRRRAVLDPAQHGRRGDRGRRPRRHHLERGAPLRVVLAMLRRLREVRHGRGRARRHRALARHHERRRQPAAPGRARTDRPSRSLAPRA